MPLIFDSFATNIPPTTSSFYAHVVTTVPTGAEATATALTLANVAGYAPIDLVVTTTTVGSATNWDFDDALWTPLPWAVSLIGVAIIFRVGATKNAAVDRPFLFYEFENGLHAPIVLTPGYFGIRFSTGTGFALTSQASTKYDVGGFLGYPLYKDLITLLASNNGNRYTPGGPYDAGQFYEPYNAGAFNLTPTCYWLGDRATIRELQNRHDLEYSNVTFPTLPSPVLGLNTAATFDGNSYITIGNTTANGADFNAYTGGNNQQLVLLFYFYPTLNNTEEILLDTTTSNTSGGYAIRKTAANKIEMLFITAGTPHSALIFTSTPSVDINAWNLVLISNYVTDRTILVNNVETNNANFAPGFNSPVLTNGIRFGARRGLNSSFAGANFSGKALYLITGNSYRPVNQTAYPIVTNRNSQLPYNPAYATGWSLTGLNTATEMIAPNVFEANKSTFIKSVNNLNTYVGAKNLVGNEAITTMRIDQPDCFYLNFGRNKVRVGTIAIVFPALNNAVLNFLLGAGTNPTSAILSIWATNALPANTPTNVNLVNPALWDKYEAVVAPLNVQAGKTGLSTLTLVTSGGYSFHLVSTGITKYYKYYRIGWKDVVLVGGGNVTSLNHFLLFDSSVLSADLDLVPPIAGYAA
jgi:hypothetical protein